MLTKLSLHSCAKKRPYFLIHVYVSNTHTHIVSNAAKPRSFEIHSICALCMLLIVADLFHEQKIWLWQAHHLSHLRFISNCKKQIRMKKYLAYVCTEGQEILSHSWCSVGNKSLSYCEHYHATVFFLCEPLFIFILYVRKFYAKRLTPTKILFKRMRVWGIWGFYLSKHVT